MKSTMFALAALFTTMPEFSEAKKNVYTKWRNAQRKEQDIFTKVEPGEDYVKFTIPATET